MQSWAAALIAGTVQLLLAQLILRRGRRIRRAWSCIRRAWSRKPDFTCSRFLKSGRHSGLSARQHSDAQRHWDVLRSHVFEQAQAKRSREALHNNYLQTLQKTVQQKTVHKKIGQADGLHYFLSSFEESQFVSHRRTGENFVRDNLDPLREMPPAYPPERAPCTYNSALLRKVLFLQPHMQEAAMDSMGVAFNAGALGALCWFLTTEEDEASPEGFESAAVVLSTASLFAEEILANFQFFPSFLLLGLLTFIVNRWQDFLVTCHTVQARLHDIGISMGMAVIKPDDQETRQLLFQLYRYLNVVHGLTYQNVHPQMPQTPNGFVYLGLLSETEASILRKCGNKQRDCVVAWCGGVMEEMARSGLVAPCFTYAPMIAGLRGITAKHHDGFVRNMPNTWYAVGRLLTDLIVCLNLLALPLKLYRLSSSEIWDSANSDVWSNHWMLVIFCLLVVASGFVISCAYWLPWSMIGVLLNPFGTGVDAYNTDALLASTDRMLFISMRALFDPKTPPPDPPQNRQRKTRMRLERTATQLAFTLPILPPLPDPEGLVDTESNIGPAVRRPSSLEGRYSRPVEDDLPRST